MQTTKSILQVNQISAERAHRILFHDLSFQLTSGDLLLIEGPNGSGKTTLLKILAGLYKQYEGEILWNGKNIHKNDSNYQDQLIHIGHKTGIKSSLTSNENLSLLLSLNFPKKEFELSEILDKMGLTQAYDSFAYQLSAGQQRRLALARLLMLEAKLWLLDEPFSALDQQGVELIFDMMLHHIENEGIIILTSHQPIELDEIKMIRLEL